MTLVQCCCSCCDSLCLLFFFFSKTFEAKIHHLETRPCRKLKDSLEGLEYFVRCEVHLSDVSTLVGSIKRNAEDVKTTKEVKCNTVFFLLLLNPTYFLMLSCSFGNFFFFLDVRRKTYVWKLHLNLMKLKKLTSEINEAFCFLPHSSSLVPKENSRFRQMSSSGHQIWSRPGSRPSCE